MTKEELEKHINLYRDAEKDITELDDKYGIRIWDSTNPNFYNKYNLVIHNLLKNIFGEENTWLIEDYIFKQIDMSFDDLWEKINSKNETDKE